MATFAELARGSEPRRPTVAQIEALVEVDLAVKVQRVEEAGKEARRARRIAEARAAQAAAARAALARQEVAAGVAAVAEATKGRKS